MSRCDGSRWFYGSLGGSRGVKGCPRGPKKGPKAGFKEGCHSCDKCEYVTPLLVIPWVNQPLENRVQLDNCNCANLSATNK